MIPVRLYRSRKHRQSTWIDDIELQNGQHRGSVSILVYAPYKLSVFSVALPRTAPYPFRIICSAVDYALGRTGRNVLKPMESLYDGQMDNQSISKV